MCLTTAELPQSGGPFWWNEEDDSSICFPSAEGGVALRPGAQRKEIPVAGAACTLASRSMCLITED